MSNHDSPSKTLASNAMSRILKNAVCLKRLADPGPVIMGHKPARLGHFADSFGKNDWDSSVFRSRRFLDPPANQGCNPSALGA